MSDYFIRPEQAENDVLACAAFLAERVESGDGHSAAISEIVPRYLRAGEVDLAAELANAVADPFARDRLLMSVAEQCAADDDDEYALQLAGSIEEEAFGAQALERIGLMQASKGRYDKALEIADTMAHPDVVLAGVAASQAANGDESAANATIERIEFPAARVSAFHQMANAAIASGASEQADTLLDDAIATAEEIEHDEEKVRALCDTGQLFIEAKRNDKAIETFDTARGFAEGLGNQHRDYFLSACALGFLNAGSVELAENTLDLVTDKTQMASALLGFAREAWKKGDKEDAVETLDEAHEILRSQREIETRDSRARNDVMASIAVQFGVFEKSDRAVEIAHSNNDPQQQTAALTRIARVLLLQNKDDAARDIVNEITDDDSRLTALITLADAEVERGEAQASLNLLEEAAAMTDTVLRHSSRSEISNELAERFAAQGKPEKARALSIENLLVITSMRDAGGQATALAAMSDVFDGVRLLLGDDEKAMLRDLVQKSEW
jgi:tetratricopeptide (TPR) repeat protein